MHPFRLPPARRAWWLAFVLLLAAAPGPAAAAEPDPQRGAYIFRASGGCTCHTDLKNGGPTLAGGRAMPTPFGVLYATNITPHRQTGLGAWSEADFIRAMRRGIGAGGEHLFPAFPYTAFAGMTERDLRDLWAYLRTVPPVERANRPDELWPPFGWRFLLGFWKWLNFAPRPFEPDPARSAEWNRGAYLSRHVAHCAECHTPRDLSGALRPELRNAGTPSGPEGALAPNITPDPETGVGNWSLTDMTWFLETALKPNGDDAQSLMGEVIEHGYRHMTPADRKAIAVYYRSLPPIRNKVQAPPRSEGAP